MRPLTDSNVSTSLVYFLKSWLFLNILVKTDHGPSVDDAKVFPIFPLSFIMLSRLLVELAEPSLPHFFFATLYLSCSNINVELNLKRKITPKTFNY